MGLALMGIVAMTGSFNMRDIVNAQENLWFIVPQFFGFCTFVIAGIAVTHRHPFDQPEAEQELADGYHIEYSGMKWGMFFVGEYIGIVLISALLVTLFFGGWHGPLLPPIVWFLLKTAFFVVLFVLLRARAAAAALRQGDELRLEGLPAADADQSAGYRGDDFAHRPEHIREGAHAESDQEDRHRYRDAAAHPVDGVQPRLARKRETLSYPEEQVYLPPRYRGRIVLTRDPDGEERCVACNLCAVACPVACISLQKGERDDGRWYPEFFRINFSRCIFCGMCEEACPTSAIQLTPDFEMSEFRRQELVYEKQDLLIRAGQGSQHQLLPCRRAVHRGQGQGAGAERGRADRCEVAAAVRRCPRTAVRRPVAGRWRAVAPAPLSGTLRGRRESGSQFVGEKVMQLAFYLSGLVAILATLRVVTGTHPVHALLYLIVSLISVAMVFLPSAPPSPGRSRSSSMPARSWCCSCSW